MITNEDRVASVSEALDAFAFAMGMDGEDPETIAGDMICNILHWVDVHSPEGKAAALTAAANGIGHYASESYIDYDAEEVDELGPDAFVTIGVNVGNHHWEKETGDKAVIEA